MDKNFKVRIAVGVGMFAVALVGLYTFNSIPFKIIYGLFALMAAVELMSFFTKKCTPFTVILAVLELVFLVCSIIFVAHIDLIHFWYIILGVPGYDIFAYFFGRLFGGKVFGSSRPFPKISKNKTWEGTIMGVAMAVSMVLIMMSVRGTFASEWPYLFCGPLAVFGDLYESYLKRKFGVKDSGEIVVRNKFFAAVEHLVGGSAGHGGFLDRIDSTAFTTTILIVLFMVVSNALV